MKRQMKILVYFIFVLSVSNAKAMSTDCQTLVSCLEEQKQLTEKLEKVSERIIEIKVRDGLVKISTTGSVFEKVNTHPDLGEAWKDPRGAIWGGIALDGEVMSQKDARKYCKSIKANLPNNGDLEYLAKQFGQGSEDGYQPQILPNINIEFFSSDYSEHNGSLHYFDPKNGKIGKRYYKNNPELAKFAVRCII